MPGAARRHQYERPVQSTPRSAGALLPWVHIDVFHGISAGRLQGDLDELGYLPKAHGSSGGGHLSSMSADTTIPSISSRNGSSCGVSKRASTTSLPL